MGLLATFMCICRVKDHNTVQPVHQAQAEEDQANCDSLHFRDDQFDLSDALIAIAVLAVISLTQLWRPHGLSLVPIGFGALFGLAGLISWGLHPTGLIKLLS